MLGKYDFNHENSKKIFKFYNPALQIISILFEDQKIQLKRDNLLNKDFEKIFNYFKNIEYLDQFKEVKDMINFYYYDFWNELISLNRLQVFDRHKYWPNIESIKQIADLLDKWIVQSYNNVKNNKEVMNLFECLNEIQNIIVNYCNNLINENFNFNKKIIEGLELIKNSNSFETIESSSEIILNMFEYNSLSSESIHNIFEENSQDYWKIFNTLTNISILSVFAIQIKEENNWNIK
ncbi:hypothetical protein [Spiroplasma endosymbiont of Cantharis lateralis]|uniref:hypothetical protein n=1 Tax=Spiroplasma endosymbiont of Cantharis lateralis TaxID=3066277 RepID=UPI00313E88F3